MEENTMEENTMEFNINTDVSQKESEWYSVDWGKINTLEDLKTINILLHKLLEIKFSLNELNKKNITEEEKVKLLNYLILDKN